MNIQQLLEHCVWANESWIRFLEEHGSTDQALVGRMSHILLGERAWFQRIADEQPDPAIWTVLPFPALWSLHEVHRGTYQRLLTEDLTRIVAYRRFTGEDGQSAVSDILIHLALHGSHHRGQLAMLASARGLKPINTDYVQFQRGQISIFDTAPSAVENRDLTP